MPELPEVETMMQALAKGIGKTHIINVSVRNNRLRQKIPDDFAQKICGAAIIGYRRAAKYIVIDLDNGLSLIWHMGMSGKIKIADKRPEIPDKHDHVIFETAAGCVVYNDARRFGLLTYCKTEELRKNPLFKHVGIDPFDKGLDEKYLFPILQKKKSPIKIVLLDQSVICGIGNIYASEILFLSRISPLRPADKITRPETGILIKNTRAVLEKAIAAGGSTIHDYKRPDGSLGYFQNMHCVYGKAGQPCPGCTCDIAKTGGIRKIIQTGRSTFYCESQQK